MTDAAESGRERGRKIRAHQRKAELFDELVEALREIADVADRSWPNPEGMGHIEDIARAALAKADEVTK